MTRLSMKPPKSITSGAPVMARMGRKLIWTTIISAIVFALGMLAYHAGYLNIERLSKLMGIPL